MRTGGFNRVQSEGSQGPDATSTEAAARALVRALRRENRALRRQVEQLEVYRQLAYRDALTGLHNRRSFDERFLEERLRAERHGTALTVIMMDVDQFKRINDAGGHAAGDAVLVWVGAFLRSVARIEDVPCRIGGDELAMILPATDAAGARAFEHRIREALETAAHRPCLPDGIELALSIGTASFPEDPAAVLVSVADARMFADKRAKRGIPGAAA